MALVYVKMSCVVCLLYSWFSHFQSEYYKYKVDDSVNRSNVNFCFLNFEIGYGSL